MIEPYARDNVSTGFNLPARGTFLVQQSRRLACASLLK